MAVPHRVDEVRVLRNLGFDAPAPIHYYYDWPGRYKPFMAQREAAAFMSMRQRAFNLGEIGVGKSLATLWAYDYLRSIGKVKKVLVVSPLSTLERTWADEVFVNFPHLNYAVLHGSREKRLKLLKQDADVYIINHDGVEIVMEALKSRDDIDLVVIDEISQVARNAGTDRWRALNTVINKQTVRQCWGLTGTPTPNGPTDAWAQCRLLVPERVPPYFNRFRELVMRQLSTYLWVPKPGATEIVHEAMQPSIRFSRDECIDLPPVMHETRQVQLSPEQAKAYKEMMSTLRAQAAAGEILAVNEAVKMSKLVQIACIAYGTEVLTDSGWVPIQNVTARERVWDGEEWVAQGGAVYKGHKRVVSIRGVRMTPDHKVWVGDWVTAEEICNGDASERLARTEVRLPSSYPTSGDYEGGPSVRHVELPVRLWERGCQDEPVSASAPPDTPEKLRMPPRERNAQDDKLSPIQYMGEDEATLFEPIQQRLAELRWTRNNGVRTLDWLISKLPRRYFRWLQERLDSWPNGQRRPVFAGELPLGDAYAAEQQSAQQQVYRHPERANDGDRSRPRVRTEESYPGGSVGTVQVVRDAGADRTYDLINCGSRNRFVVRGANKETLIVHNCGIAYDVDGEEVAFPNPHRNAVVQEIVEGSVGKVIVFVPFVSAVKAVAQSVSKYASVEFIHGGVSKAERDRILGAFQKSDTPKVLVAQPATLSHGLTLTAANTIVWYSCITSNDIYEQANGRIVRPGQRNNQFIIMLEGTPIEKKIYDRLKNKQKLQGALLEEVKNSRNSVLA